jgi:HEPN domain-containing protein
MEEYTPGVRYPDPEEGGRRLRLRVNLVQAWCEKGRRDFITAQNGLLDTTEFFLDIVCFHAQQAAEKYQKVYLVFLGRDFKKNPCPWKISFLLHRKRIHRCDHSSRSQANVSPYSIEIRYPDIPPPSPEDAREAVESADGKWLFGHSICSVIGLSKIIIQNFNYYFVL